MSFPEIDLAHYPILYKNSFGSQEIRMDEFSRNRSHDRGTEISKKKQWMSFPEIGLRPK